jgi:Flp pilus assembly protein TadD
VVDLIGRDAVAAPSARAWLPAHRASEGPRHILVDLTVPPPASAGTDLAVVLDDSAATDPATLEVARAALDALLRQLGREDRVALFLGDLGARPAAGDAGQLLAVDEARRERILDAVARARPGGASDLARMLVDAHGALDPRRNGVVLYLGDGAPTVGTIDPARLAEEIRRQAPDLRLQALALGRDAHAEVLRPIAAGGGSVAQVEDPADAVARVTQMAARAMRPCYRDVRVILGDHVHHVLPAVQEAWVAGDPLRFAGELDAEHDPPKQITVEAREGGATRRWTIPLRPARVLESGDLARRWATARVAQLADTGAGRASLAEIGARFGLVTSVSALLVGVAPAAQENAWNVNDSPWPADPGVGRLPSLGVGTLAPRGVQTLGEPPELAVAVDDGTGWQPHRAGENRGYGGAAALVAALAGAEPAARACVARKRALRPGLAGDVTVAVTVDAAGQLSDAAVTATSMGDAETEGCIRRAVAGLTLPAPELLGATPGRVQYSFTFPGVEGGQGYAARSCPPSAALPRSLRRVLWRERIAARGASAQTGVAVWREAMARCELRWWEDRVALMDLLLGSLADPAELVRIRDGLDDASARDWFDAALARRFGASRAWVALHRPLFVDWDALLARLAAPAITVEQRVALLRAWLNVAPRDIDLRLRLLATLEEAGRTREARVVADGLRRDPIADARVRGMVGEFLLRAGDRPEALRAFTEIAEFAPYDPWARTRLGDLLLTYAEPEQAYRQYQTLALLDPGDPMPAARVGVAALAAGREDEGLRTIRRAVEVAGADAVGRAVQSLLDTEVARLAATRGSDSAVRAWVRVARQLRAGREPDVLVRWTHPDVGIELLAQRPSETAATSVGDAPSTLGLRVFTSDIALEGFRFVLRGAVGLHGARRAEVVLGVLDDARLVEQRVTLDRTRRAAAFVLRDGRLVEAPLLPTEAPTTPPELY